jgi:EmrB/QacA subfamily drug resistance transporter
VSSSTESADTQTARTDAPPGPADPLRWWSLLAVGLATFMTYLDLNIISVAIPTVQRNLHLSVAGLEWVVSSYLLTLAGLLLAGGRLADAYGRRRLFMTGLAIFTLASLAAGLSGSGGVLIASRAVQGLGAALLTPATLAIIMASFTDLKERTTAIGLWTVSAAMGLAIGPVAGGLISQNLHWGWIFLVNVPVGVVTFAITLRAVRESRAPGMSGSLDARGLVTSAICLLALAYALIEGNDRGWTSVPILAAFALAAVTAAIFFAIEAHSAEPMVDLKMFRIRQFSGGTSVQMIWSFGLLGIYFFTSIYLQEILGFSPIRAALLFVPMAFSLAVCAIASSLVERLIGGHRTVVLGVVMMAAALIPYTRFGEHASFVALLPSIILLGGGTGMMNVPLTNVVLQSTPQERAGVASALLNDSRELATLLGITVLGAVLSSSRSAALRAGSSPAHAFVDGYHAGLWVTIALLGVGVVVGYVTLRPGKPVT